jgi:hypothetical protein
MSTTEHSNLGELGWWKMSTSGAQHMVSHPQQVLGLSEIRTNTNLTYILFNELSITETTQCWLARKRIEKDTEGSSHCPISSSIPEMVWKDWLNL